MAAFVAIILISSTVSYVRFSSIYRERIVEDLNQIMIKNQINIDHMIDGIDQATMLVYDDKTITDILTSTSTDYLTNYKNKELINNQLNKYIYVPLSNNFTSYEIIFYVNDTMPFARSLSASNNFQFSGLFSDEQARNAPWFRQTMRKDGELYWFQDNDNSNRIFVARLIKNSQLVDEIRRGGNADRANLGVIVINFDISQIHMQIKSTKLTDKTQVVLLNENDEMIYRQGSSLKPEMFESIYKQYLKAGQSTAYDVSYEDQAYIVNVREIKNGWKTVSLIPQSDISEQMGGITNIIVTATVLAIVAGIALSLLISTRISLPIRKLATTMGGVQSKNSMETIVVPQSNDEVGILYVNYNRMINRINELMGDVYQSGIKEKDAELKALQAQINPHFLYNTLDSVNWMALGIGADEISETISSLANILRYSIKDPNKLVPIFKEVEQIKHYIAIRMICYGAEFDVSYELEPEALGFLMPKLILQPLVENAIQHGIEKSPGKGRIAIAGKLREGVIVLTVDNSGDGSSDVNAINAYLTAKPTSLRDEDRDGGYGIPNVHQRIQLLYGKPYGLRYEPNADGGVKVVVTLPT